MLPFSGHSAHPFLFITQCRESVKDSYRIIEEIFSPLAYMQTNCAVKPEYFFLLIKFHKSKIL